MELAPLVGLADAIVDLVSTGNTLKANGLSAVEEIASISARLVVNQASLKLKRDALQPLVEISCAGRGVIRRLSTTQSDFDARLAELLAFEAAQDPRVDAIVASILSDVKVRGDAALLEHTRRLDAVTVDSPAQLEIPADECEKALAQLPSSRRAALEAAAGRVRRYHEHQRAESWTIADEEANELGQKVTPLDRVGVYVPGGKAAYPSSVIMNVMPAKVAGVGEVIMAVPTPSGERNALVLAAAALCGVDRVFTIGGAQAIGALAYGTKRCPPWTRSSGPGTRMSPQRNGVCSA